MQRHMVNVDILPGVHIQSGEVEFKWLANRIGKLGVNRWYMDLCSVG